MATEHIHLLFLIDNVAQLMMRERLSNSKHNTLFSISNRTRLTRPQTRWWKLLVAGYCYSEYSFAICLIQFLSLGSLDFVFRHSTVTGSSSLQKRITSNKD